MTESALELEAMSHRFAHTTIHIIVVMTLMCCGRLDIEDLSESDVPEHPTHQADSGADAPCKKDGDCAFCDDGILNGEEIRVDCGGRCAPCSPCDAPFDSPEPLFGFDLSGSLFGPSLSRDGATLYFSERTDTSENLLMATRSDHGKRFAEATLVTELNTDFYEGSPFLTVDGRTLYFCSTRGDGEVRDLWSSTRSSVEGAFEDPIVLFWVNSDHNDHHPTLPHAQQILMFASDRPEGRGGDDIWVSAISSRGDYFDIPTPVAELNTPAVETSPSLSGDGLTLFFISDRPDGVGGADIWTAARSDIEAPFDSPTPVTMLNSAQSEFDVALTPDEQELFFSSDRDGDIRLWRARRDCP